MESTFTAQLEFSFREAVKLLVVDDDADTRQMLSVYFSGQEYSVATASSGKEALDAMKRNGNFDLVLLDLVIPDIGGLELLTDINRRSEPPSVIVPTGLADKQIAQNALRLGHSTAI